jgi:hypothetical protein
MIVKEELYKITTVNGKPIIKEGVTAETILVYFKLGTYYKKMRFDIILIR